MSILITMCVCQRMPFDRLLPIARQNGWDLPAIMRETQCGAGCGLCRPYLRQMLETERTVFTEILTETE
jgi:NAD(P)H-nitrite reductase large subunit